MLRCYWFLYVTPNHSALYFALIYVIVYGTITVRQFFYCHCQLCTNKFHHHTIIYLSFSSDEGIGTHCWWPTVLAVGTWAYRMKETRSARALCWTAMHKVPRCYHGVEFSWSNCHLWSELSMHQVKALLQSGGTEIPGGIIFPNITRSAKISHYPYFSRYRKAEFTKS